MKHISTGYNSEMRIRILALILFILPFTVSALFQDLGSSYSPYFDSFFTEIPQTLDLDEYAPSPLSLWSRAKVDHLCRVVDEPRHSNDTTSYIKPSSLNTSADALFRHISIRGDWGYAVERLNEMQDCPAAFTYVRTFKFDLYIGNSLKEPPQSLPSQLASQLARMTDLEKLVLVIPELHAHTFAAQIALRNVILPYVHTLVVGPSCEFAMTAVPNLSTVSTNGDRGLHRIDSNHTLAFIEAAGTATNVTNLQVSDRWSARLLEAILVALPNLPNLTMGGSLDYTPFAELLPVISRLEKLQRLAIPDASLLGVGFDPPWCGNAYFDENGNENSEFVAQVKAQGEEAERKVLGMVAPVFRNLTELWIGDHSMAEILRDQGGNVTDVIWHRGDLIDKVVHYPRP